MEIGEFRDELREAFDLYIDGAVKLQANLNLGVERTLARRAAGFDDDLVKSIVEFEMRRLSVQMEERFKKLETLHGTE